MQHWWHPPSGRGVRTRISDDRVWLPYVAAHYVDVTGDVAVLDEMVPFLDGPLARRRTSTTLSSSPTIAGRARHAVRALRAGARPAASQLGAHGLPLMGTGDWNDGMNRVGAARARARASGSAGSSTTTLRELRAARRGARRTARAPRSGASTQADLQAAARARRAGTATGTAAPTSTTARRSARRRASECRIDSIAQSWA